MNPPNFREYSYNSTTTKSRWFPLRIICQTLDVHRLIHHRHTIQRERERERNAWTIMQARLLLVGPIPTTIDASASFSSSSSIITGGHNSLIGSWTYHPNLDNKSRHRKNNKWGPTVVVASSSSSWAAINGGEQDHYAVLGLERTATSADIKKAYRFLARKVILIML